MMLTGEDILASLGKHIIIYPFDSKRGLRSSNYNLKVGKFVWLHPGPEESSSRQTLRLPLEGISTEAGRRYDIPPGALVSILTKEVVWVDNTVAGLFHSKVDMVTKGFSHISTTLDPGWKGPLLITMRNCSTVTLPLWEGETFVKLSFHRLSHPTKIGHNNPPGRSDRLLEQGLRFPEGYENFLDEPVNCDLEALKREFFDSQEWKDIQHRRAFAIGQVYRLAAFVLVLLALVTVVTARSWFPLLFGIMPGDEALAGIMGGILGAVLVFLFSLLYRTYQ